VHIDVIPCVNEARTEIWGGKTVLVIDVLRATTCIVTALENGAASVYPADTVASARNGKRSGDLLGGERYGKRIQGFDLGNSPLEYTPQIVSGRRVILTTTNGTRAVRKARKAAWVIAACLRNARAAANAAYGQKRDIVILCAGVQDTFSFEDGLCAGMIIEEIFQRKKTEDEVYLNDFALAMHSLYLFHRHRLEEAINGCSGGRKLKKMGFGEDVRFCAEPNVSGVVPVLHQGEMIVYTDHFRESGP